MNNSDREYKKTILEPNRIADKKTGLDKYLLTWADKEVINARNKNDYLG